MTMSTRYNLTVVLSFLEERVNQVISKMEAEGGFEENDPEYLVVQATANDLFEVNIMFADNLLECLNDYFFIEIMLVGAKCAPKYSST